MAHVIGLSASIICVVAALAGSAEAQKNSGPLLPTSPPPYTAPPYASPPRIPSPYASPSYAAPPHVPPAPRPLPSAAAPRVGNPDAERLAQSLPLDTQTQELRDQMPGDPRGTERRLGLREPRGPATDLRGRTPSPREIVDALAPR